MSTDRAQGQTLTGIRASMNRDRRSSEVDAVVTAGTFWVVGAPEKPKRGCVTRLVAGMPALLVLG